MRAFDFAVRQILPPDMHRDKFDFSKKGLGELMLEAAQKHPDQYAQISQGLGDLGRNNAWFEGFTVTDEDMEPVIDRDRILAKMDGELDALRSRRAKMTPDEFTAARDDVMLRYSKIIQDETSSKATAAGNSWARMVSSGARGNAAHTQAILSTPGIYADAQGRIIPLFVRNSFSDGVRPAEHLAGTYGGRASVVSTKRATARGGDIAKLLNQNASKYNITEVDCGTKNGIDLDPLNNTVARRTLARDTAGIPAGTVLDRKSAEVLRKAGKPVIIRSAMTCRAEHGLCAKCYGALNNGKLPSLGDGVGLMAATAISEPIVQGSLNCLMEGTLVRMADYSLRRIQDVRVGDWVLGADIHGNTFPVEVLAVHDQGLQPAQTYTYRMGQTKETISATCTTEHPLLQTTYYTNCKDEALNYTPRKLPAGVKAGRPSAVLPVTAPTSGMVEVFAAVIGYFLGDGIRWVPKNARGAHQQLRVSCACEATAADLNAILAEHELKLVKCKRSHDWRVSQCKGSSRRFNEFKATIKRLGLDSKYAHEKSIPDEVWSWDAESVTKLLAGFVSADGSVHQAGSTTGVSFASTSRTMLENLRDLLRVRLCVYACPTTRTNTADTNNYVHDMWAFTVTRRDQVTALASAIARHIPGKKGAKLDAYIAGASPSHYAGQPFFKAKRHSITDAGVVQCWDLSVNHPDELFVLGNSLIVKNTKHNSGMAKGKKSFSGLDYVSQFVQIPEDFKDQAALSEIDGMVDGVREAPQGGNYVIVEGQDHYVPAGTEVLVKPGDRVEAGQELSDGLASARDVVRLRGVGAGRKYYRDRLGQMLADSGNPPDMRNMEVVARANVDSYMVDDPDEDSPFLPDEVVRESALLKFYKPRATKPTPMKAAGNKYLDEPVLHYSVGTRITPSITKHLESVGVKEAMVADTPPSFSPHMERLRTNAHDTRDWLEGLSTSYLGSQLRESLERGDETNIKENYHYAPRLAVGVDMGAGAFAENIKRTGKF